ncbi:MAG TPA: hypothetical protein VG276_06275 [Actinomycetes bacterium]|nr:hypothetical protein [Actinomycetes bacterium]
MANWYLAPSLRALFAEVNRAAPGRRKQSDGTVGDSSHKRRKSDHNPDWGAGGVVRAVDLTHDPAGGLDCNWLAGKLQASHDPRVSYVIWNRRIMSGSGGPSPWRWRRYNGQNPHNHHLHVSIMHSRAAETDTGSWLGGPPATVLIGSVDPVVRKGWDEMATKDELKTAVREVLREELQNALSIMIEGDPGTNDGGSHPHNLRNINRAAAAIRTKVGA